LKTKKFIIFSSIILGVVCTLVSDSIIKYSRLISGHNKENFYSVINEEDRSTLAKQAMSEKERRRKICKAKMVCRIMLSSEFGRSLSLRLKRDKNCMKRSSPFGIYGSPRNNL